MKLKERFKKWLDTNPRLQIREVQLEVIADEFAIGFLEWYFSNEGDDLIHDLILVGEVDKNTTIKELLEIYKTEKGL